MTTVAAPPSPQEIHRKLSVHSMAGKSPRVAATPGMSGTESDSDTILPAESTLSPWWKRSVSGGEDSEDEDADSEEGGWKTAETEARQAQGSMEESVIKAGYLWKKGERRKTWKKRWFVLRPAHLAYYKTAAEYQLLRLLDLADVHSCTKVALKRHENTFGLVSPIRTFYLQAKNPGEVHDWVKAIDEARQVLQAAASGSASNPIPIPRGRLRSNAPPPVTPSPPSLGYYMTSSDSEDNASPIGTRSYSLSSQTRPTVPLGGTSPSAKTGAVMDPAKTILSGYLMKCGSKRRNWRKRWFVLSGEQLIYSGSHMDTKPHRRFPFSEILDALEYDLPANRQNPALIAPPTTSPPVPPAGDDEANDAHTFKIVTTKRTLLLCAPSEEDEIKWLGAVRALIARRSGSGGVPGDSTKIPTNDISPTASGMSSGGSGLITRVRRPSASGSATAGMVEGSSQ
ncbi:Pleckstrin y domain-containing family A member 1 [Mycena sanguinolenta]|uniref:Pleckstrin y domain-containing family A member 1 n=1 Tax=Mycena sanguinolenta TaxID=230812 RepID=A0A8H7DGJ6_9AGAR|nr:Pleckstrin y domain-containing family A member 1 [Mycena sanguinolenta]